MVTRMKNEKSLKAKIAAVLAGADVVKAKDEYDDYEDEDEIEEDEGAYETSKTDPSDKQNRDIIRMLLGKKIKEKLNSKKENNDGY